MFALPIHRLSVSGAYVPCWPTDQPDPVLVSSYHRTPACGFVVGFGLTLTDWLRTTASVPLPRLRYAAWYMRRSDSASRPCDVPGCGMQSRLKLHKLESKVATGMVVLGDPLLPNVELAGLDQSTWKSHSSIWSLLQGPPLAASHDMKYGFGAPLGGLDPSAAPSALDGSRLEYCEPMVNCTEVACWPASIWARSNAVTVTPVNVWSLTKS